MTDLQSRLRGIEERLDTIHKALSRPADPGVVPMPWATVTMVASLAFELSYVTTILRKHLETGER